MAKSSFTPIVDYPSFVSVSVGIGDHPGSTFAVILPLSFILGLPTTVSIGPIAMPTKFLKISLVPIAVGVDNCPLNKGIVFELAFENGAVV